MRLKDEIVRSGNYLFRWRSYLPLLFLPFVVLALRDSGYFLESEWYNDLWGMFCFAVAVVGLTVRVLTVGHVSTQTSGRNTKQQLANALNTTGIYSTVRHPLYFGNFLIWLGVALFPHSWWLVMVAVLVFWVYYERIMLAEEDFLATKFGTEYETWAGRTNAFIPTLRNWQPPTLPFSWKFVLSRENSSLFATVVTFFLLELSRNFFAGKALYVDLGWILFFTAGVVVYTFLRWLKKRKLLSVEGR